MEDTLHTDSPVFNDVYNEDVDGGDDNQIFSCCVKEGGDCKINSVDRTPKNRDSCVTLEDGANSGADDVYKDSIVFNQEKFSKFIKDSYDLLLVNNSVSIECIDSKITLLYDYRSELLSVIRTNEVQQRYLTERLLTHQKKVLNGVYVYSKHSLRKLYDRLDEVVQIDRYLRVQMGKLARVQRLFVEKRKKFNYQKQRSRDLLALLVFVGLLVFCAVSSLRCLRC
ncbi:hypothetical protein MACK_000179 [Theileria orientalis]|uniref:Uncharacterized protein n=1 Tax=Theileria orientalis TaxID=68886 RepID=A0A976M9H8_THEOR|nr:hypothetical protein MACK_000179 [Theileria orientalis]